MKKKHKSKKKINKSGILNRVFEDFKNRQKIKEKKELKAINEQIKKDQEKIKFKEKEQKIKEEEQRRKEESLKRKDDEIKLKDKDQKRENEELRSELSAFDVSFFNEIEDLKYRESKAQQTIIELKAQLNDINNHDSV